MEQRILSACIGLCLITATAIAQQRPLKPQVVDRPHPAKDILGVAATARPAAVIGAAEISAPMANAMIADFSHGVPSVAPVGFEENKGQVRTTEGENAPLVRYRLSQGSTQLFLLGNGIAYQFGRANYPEGYREAMRDQQTDPAKVYTLREQVRLETFRMDMRLEGANPAARITTEGQSSDYTQYYNHGALDVHTYSKVTYHEIYPGIDWVVHTTTKGLKYDFVVRPGADPDLIRLRFVNHEELYVNDQGGLVLGNRMGQFTEKRPESIQDGRLIGTRFVLEDDVLHFAVENHDRSRELVIDPDLIWATYYGGSGGDEGYDCAVDNSGNVYNSGGSLSLNSIASGGYQNTNGGEFDAYLVKFNSSGVRQWATYYGGAGSDYGIACAADASGNVYLAGRTGSFTGIASGGHQNTIGGGDADGFLAKFNSSGTRLWGTYYGGPSTVDFIQDCAVDASGNVFIAGHTESLSGIAENGFQNTYGGLLDAYLVKFSSSGVRQWGTYYGGTDNDNGWGCAIDGSGNVYLSGSSKSTSGIASGGYQNALSGQWDAILVKFSTNGTRLWATYYGGTADDGYGTCAADPSGNIFLSGSTSSSTGIASGGHQNTFAGGSGEFFGDAFLAKFDPAGVRQWGTYFGGPGGEFGRGVAPDLDGGVYLRGQTESSSGIAYDGYQNTYAGSGDLFLAKFSNSGSRIWATYYGGSNAETVSEVGGVASGSNKEVYLTGITWSSSGIAFNGHQNTFSGGAQDAFLAKFEGGATITTGAALGPICAGQAVSIPFTTTGTLNPGNTFTAELSNASGSFASPVVIGSLVGTTSGSISASIPLGTAPGTGYRIRVMGSDPATTGTDNGTDLTIHDRTTNCTCDDLAESEPNNSGGAANAIQYDTPISGITGPCSLLDNTADYFSFTTTDQCVLRVQACLSNSGPTALNVTFRVLNTGGATLGTFTLPAGANNATVAGEFLFPCRGIGAYRIAVDNPSTIVCTHYAFSYTILPPVFGNDPEPNDGIGASATPVAYNTDRDGRNNFDLESSYDYYSITLPTNGVLNIETQAEHAGAVPGTMAVALLNSVGSVLQTWNVAVGANGTPAADAVSITCRSTVSTYYIRINSAACGTSYRFKYTVTAPLFANDPEPNNGIGASATPVAYNTDRDGQNNFDGESTYDYYSITLPTNGVLNIETQAEHAGTTPSTMAVVLLNSIGSALETWNVAVGANGTAVTNTVSTNCRSTVSTYYIRINSAICGTSYRFKYTVTAPHFAADLEPNNSQPGTTLVHDTYTEGQLQFEGENPFDYYNIVAPTNGVMNFEVQAEHVGATPGTVELKLFSFNGTSLQTWTVDVGANGIPDTTVLSIPCRSTVHPYSVRLYTTTTCGVSYRLKYTVTAPHFSADVEPNDNQPGTALAHDTYAEGQLLFENETPYDIYRITPSVNGKVDIEVQAEHTGAVPGTITVALLNTSGSTLQSWSVPVGASGVPITSMLSKTCLNGGTSYDLRLLSSVCGASYKLKYTLTPTVFTNDVEPNNSTGQAIVLTETQTTQGNVNTSDGDNTDTYRANLSGDGVINVHIEAEHAGPETTGTVTVLLYLSNSTVLETWTVPVGAGSIPISTVLSHACLGNSLPYYLRISSNICLTSYRISYTLTPPHFAADVEPNNGSPGTSIAHDTYTEGHLEFFNLSSYDYYNIIPPINGVMVFEVQAEHAGAVEGTMQVQLANTVGTPLQAWTIPVGANGVPVTSTLSIPCLSLITDYDLRLSSTTCGVSYRFKYTMQAPAFANDVEPNNTSPGTPLAQDTYTDGNLSFYNESTYDYYNIIPPTNGVMTFEVQAEHAGAVSDSMQVQLANTVGTPLQTWMIPVGANGIPVTSTLSISCLKSTTDYDLRLYSYGCGTSYRLKYTMGAPVFANDVEPNNSTSEPTIFPLATPMTGQINFDNDENVDYYRIDLPTDGVLNVTIEAEHADLSTTETVAAYISVSTGATLATWNAAVGAGSSPTSTSFSLSCRGTNNPYYLSLVSNVCGVSYRVSWTVTAPVFANDPEPNNGGPGTPMDLNTGEQQGHIGFYNLGDPDYFGFTHPGGPWSVTVSAEHAGAGEGTMTMIVAHSTSTVYGTFTVPVGGSSTAAVNTFSIPSLPASANYYLIMQEVTCGVSYRIHCYDDDNDGICNAFDLCAGGPEPGSSCDDGDPETFGDVVDNACTCTGASAAVNVSARVILEGPYNSGTGLMNDALRGLGTFPLTDPYPGLGYTHTGGGNGGSVAPPVLAVPGNDAIVDWVLLELRSAAISANIVASRSALLQRDGDIVELDGTSPVAFAVAPSNYYVAVRQRNHLGCMTAGPIALSPAPVTVDYTTNATTTYGTQARKSMAGSFPAEALWAGDVTFNAIIKYAGSGNDRDPILVTVGSTTPNNTVSNTYSTRDVNLNGEVKYTGSGNDRDPILVNVGSTTPNNIRVQQLP